ncbi:hypothetical protein ATCC90586_000625 [Pythium insidiosum]|nr:hypothetical protein ATCC90586_000625 [Pythium insidiosum]
MVFRIFWNTGAGLVHRALNKNTMKPGYGLLYPAVWRARPGFLDCDVNMHLNNASYLYNMELARWHFSAATGIVHEAVKKRQMFLVGSQSIRYRHPIPPFRPYEIRTQVVYWDDSWVYFLHHFQCPTTGKLYAEGLCRATVKEGKRRVSGQELYYNATGLMVDTPKEVPAIVEEFLAWDSASRASMETSEEEKRRGLMDERKQRRLATAAIEIDNDSLSDDSHVEITSPPPRRHSLALESPLAAARVTSVDSGDDDDIIEQIEELDDDPAARDANGGSSANATNVGVEDALINQVGPIA